jgi:hypothetical protein
MDEEHRAPVTAQLRPFHYGFSEDPDLVAPETNSRPAIWGD